MNWQALRDKAQRGCPPFHQRTGTGDMLGAALGGTAAGGIVYVIGNGPSAAEFVHEAIEPGAKVIVCNGAIALFPKADVWLTQESTVYHFPWFYGHEAFKGVSVHEQFILDRDPEHLYLGAYSEDYWNRVVWAHRSPVTPAFDIRKQNHGLADYRDGELAGEPLGSVVLYGCHLAGIMGAHTIHVYGAEFYFPNGAQHATGDAPYKPEPNPGPVNYTGIVNFDVRDGEPVIAPDGQFKSTPYFIESSRKLRKFIALAAEQGVTIVDHSAGLLNPAALQRS